MGRIKPVELTSRAIKDLKKFKSFNIELYGMKKAREINDAIFEQLDMLENPNFNFSEIGKVDEEFKHLKYNYRKIILHYCKITYRMGKSKIYVVRIFDSRQNPKRNI